MAEGIAGECGDETGVEGAEFGDWDADAGVACGGGGGSVGGGGIGFGGGGGLLGGAALLDVVVDGGGDSFGIVESLYRENWEEF